jgi:hypothetical protein
MPWRRCDEVWHDRRRAQCDQLPHRFTAHGHSHHLRTGRLGSLRCSVRRCIFNAQAVAEMLPPFSVSTRWICSHSRRGTDSVLSPASSSSGARMSVSQEPGRFHHQRAAKAPSGPAARGPKATQTQDMFRLCLQRSARVSCTLHQVFLEHVVAAPIAPV